MKPDDTSEARRWYRSLRVATLKFAGESPLKLKSVLLAGCQLPLVDEGKAPNSFYARLAKLANAAGLDPVSWGFDSLIGYLGDVA